MRKARKNRDLYREVTDRVVRALEEGVGPWVRPWQVAGRHKNAVTGRFYRGVNVLLLNIAMLTKGYSTPLWLTYREARQVGGHIRKGEHGTTVVFWKIVEVEEKDEAGRPVIDPETGEVKRRSVPFLRYYTVFNLEQCEGYDPRKIRSELEPEFRRICTDGVMPLVEQVLSLPRIVHRGDRAYYALLQDVIVLPPRGLFRDLQSYYATALHETAHWTGHSTRLNRQFGQRFGDAAYAFEELVAEMASAFLCAQLGVELDGLQHPEYINSWLQVLKGDRKAIFTAAREAQKACDWLLERAGIAQSEPEPEQIAA